MLIQVKRWRIMRVTMAHLREAAGVGEEGEGKEVASGLRKAFGPLGPRVRFFFPEPSRNVDGNMISTRGCMMVAVGIEVESFDVRAPGIPFAGLAHADPMDELDLAREEGALRGEMERLGIRADVDKMEWRFSYDVRDQ